MFVIFLRSFRYELLITLCLYVYYAEVVFTGSADVYIPNQKLAQL